MTQADRSQARKPVSDKVKLVSLLVLSAVLIAVLMSSVGYINLSIAAFVTTGALLGGALYLILSEQFLSTSEQDWGTGIPHSSLLQIADSTEGVLIFVTETGAVYRFDEVGNRLPLGNRDDVFRDLSGNYFSSFISSGKAELTSCSLGGEGCEPYHLTPLKGSTSDGSAGVLLLAIPAIVSEPIPAQGRSRRETDDLDSALAQVLESFRAAPFGIAIVEHDGQIRDNNQVFSEMLGVQHFVGQSILQFIDDEDRKRVLRQINLVALGTEDTNGLEIGFKTRVDTALEKRGKLFMSRLGVDDDDALVIVYLVDTTAQQELELQFAQSQKMQAVGQLAGGVAHDFNNLLTAIIGFCDLLIQRHPAGDPSFADIMQIQQNANRAANLTRQLLAFSRKQTLQPKILSVTEVLSDITNLIRRLLGDQVELKIDHQRGVGRIKADAGQIEQVIVNLAVNARDAMPDGGVLTISTRKIELDQARLVRQQHVPKGSYVLLSVSDTGTGIPVHELDKVFEPFFTTKTVGQGTGLGLSTVDGIISQSGGFVEVTSDAGQGTTFSIYLPEVTSVELEQEATGLEAGKAERDLSGKETILLVEDEDAVRMFAARALSNKGYEVLVAEDGEVALKLLDDYEGPLSLIISDVMMPNMDGPTMMSEVVKSRPDIKLIFISGYADEAFEKGIDPAITYDFLPKPFSLADLAEKVRDVLEQPS